MFIAIIIDALKMYRMLTLQMIEPTFPAKFLEC